MQIFCKFTHTTIQKCLYSSEMCHSWASLSLYESFMKHYISGEHTIILNFRLESWTTEIIKMLTHLSTTLCTHIVDSPHICSRHVPDSPLWPKALVVFPDLYSLRLSSPLGIYSFLSNNRRPLVSSPTDARALLTQDLQSLFESHGHGSPLKLSFAIATEEAIIWAKASVSESTRITNNNKGKDRKLKRDVTPPSRRSTCLQ